MALALYAESKLTVQHLFHLMLHSAIPSRMFYVPPLYRERYSSFIVARFFTVMCQGKDATFG